jgi:uncharacterized protein (DUF885 family)
MRRILISSVAVLALCAAAPVVLAQEAPAAATTEAQSEDARLNAFFDQAFQARIALSPQQMTSLGQKTDYDKLDDVSDAASARSLALQEAQLARMKAEFDPSKLSTQSRLSWRLFEYGVQQARLSNQWRDWGFQFAANGNPTTSLPVFMINNHGISSVSDAEAYVARLGEAERYMGQVATTLKARAAEGVVSPRFVFEPSIENTRAVIAGAPFDKGADNPVWADFQKKVGALNADQATKDRLLASARAALTGPYKRGFDAVLTALAEVQPMADSDAGVWRLPNGEAYYNARLQLSTTTDLTADQIHQIGLGEVARIQAEMEVIKGKVGFEGSLQDFFVFLKTDPRFQYPNTPEGKEQYLTDARAFIAQVMAIAPQWFSDLPKAALEVRAVEPFREATASIAFYNSPAPDGSRPGIYYVNLSDMTQVLKPQIEGISYHEGAPGHHFQIAYAQEIEGLPRFRRFGGYGAYAEGWGLYAEQLGKEMGFYRAVARGASGHRHRPARQALEPGTGDGLFPPELPAFGTRHRQGGRALHHQPGPGDQLQDRRAEDRRTACQGRGDPGRQVRHQGLPCRGSRLRLGAAGRAGRSGRRVDRRGRGQAGRLRLAPCSRIWGLRAVKGRHALYRDRPDHVPRGLSRAARRVADRHRLAREGAVGLADAGHSGVFRR